LACRSDAKAASPSGGLETAAPWKSFADRILCVTALRRNGAPANLKRAPNMKRILVAIDFSDATPCVIELARQIAKALDAEIHLVHVRELTAAPAAGPLGYGLAGMPELAPMSGVPVSGFESVPQTIQESETQKSQLAQWRKQIAQDGIKVSLHEPAGVVAEEILNQANTINADLIVMGTHGHGAMYDFLVGCTTKGVLKHARRPVLLVPGRKPS
jgi:nucleotide-binding universal stress UspA family protein